jgi:hypothetical protein
MVLLPCLPTRKRAAKPSLTSTCRCPAFGGTCQRLKLTDGHDAARQADAPSNAVSLPINIHGGGESAELAQSPRAHPGDDQHDQLGNFQKENYSGINTSKAAPAMPPTPSSAPSDIASGLVLAWLRILLRLFPLALCRALAIRSALKSAC